MLLAEEELQRNLDNIGHLVLAMKTLGHLFSASLCVVLVVQKHMSKQGRLSVNHTPEIIMENFKLKYLIQEERNP